MDIAGFQKNSFIDYPGKIAAVIFCGGCNYNCWYCHNRHILLGDYPAVNEKEVFAYLEKRRGMVDAVVFSGGEATLQKDLGEYMKRVKGMGYLVKLDTNGAKPEALDKLIRDGLVDYVAMDIKAPFDRYKEVTGVAADVGAVKKSIDLLMNWEEKSKKVKADKANEKTKNLFDYEFRTTCVPQFKPADIESIAEEIAGARLYAMQQYRHTGTENKVTPISLPPHEKSFFIEAKALAEKYVGNVVIKGIQVT